jgi:hypothetical protein
MRSASLILLAASLAGCAGTLYSASKAPSAATPDDAYTCVQNQMKKLGYQRLRYDQSERWYVGQKVDDKASVSDVRFRKRLNRLDVRVRPDATGSTSLEVKAQTLDQYGDQQGVNETEQTASNQVKLDARELIEACSK